MFYHSSAGKILPLQQSEEAGVVHLKVRTANAMIRQGSTVTRNLYANQEHLPIFLAEGQSVSTSSVFRCLDLVAASLFISLIYSMRNRVSQ